MIRRVGAVLALWLVAGAAWAGTDQLLYQSEPPAWVEPATIPLDAKPSGAAADVLLLSVQDRLGPDGTAAFVERAVRINAPEGLQAAGSLAQVWDPGTDSLTIHRARILRDGKVVDLLAGGRRFTVLRRETNLEAAMIDGTLTANLQPEGLQVGDVLDFAFTLVRREPAFAGHAQGGALVAHAGTIGRLMVRSSWPSGRPVHVWKTDDLPALTPIARGGWTEISLDQSGAVSPEPPKGAPVYDRLFGIISVNDFKDWREVSATAWPLYDRAASLPQTSPLRAEIARIRASSPDPKARALAALKLVEGQTRYLFVGLDAGGLTPAAADLTWTRRFGDCKGKTALLIALLRGLDIAAEPVLVNTASGEALDRELPSLTAFDHVLVRADIGGRGYWLDGTRMGDENLDAIVTPNDHWGLPVRRAGADLEPVAPAPPVLPYAQTLLKVDLTGGLDRPAPVHAEMVFRGDVGLLLSLELKKASPTDTERALRQAFVSAHNWFHPDTVSFSYDPQGLVAKAVADGSGSPPFSGSAGGSGAVKEWTVDGAAIGYSPDFARASSYHASAPYAVDHPAYSRNVVEVSLPGRGRGFEVVNGERIAQTVAGVAYTRAADIHDGKLVLVASARSVAPSFPASEASAAAATLHSLDDYDAFLRYTPQEAAAPTASAAPAAKPAASPVETAEAAFVRKDYAAAEAGFTAALARSPSAKLLYNRGAARLGRGDHPGAEADFAAALRLEPKHALSHYALGRIDLDRGDLAGGDRPF